MRDGYVPVTPLDIRKWFGDQGNYEDYWLQADRPDPREGIGWESIDTFVLDPLRREELALWGPDWDAIVSLMRYDTERGGGLQGGTPELTRIRAGLVGRGSVARHFEESIRKMSQQ
jgi:hypothetical protein